MTRQTDPAEIVKTLPDWVIEEALRRCGYSRGVNTVCEIPHAYSSIILLAQALLEPAMEPPVDPLVMMAREICAEAALRYGFDRDAKDFSTGNWDDGPLMLSTIARLRQAKGEG